MLKDFLNNLKELSKELGGRLRASRLFLLGTCYAFLLAVIVLRLYRLQILDGETYLNDYIQKTEKTVTSPATRGNIFDCNGKLLAYNRLSYNVTVQDTGDYKTVGERNAMLYRLVKILNAHGMADIWVCRAELGPIRKIYEDQISTLKQNEREHGGRYEYPQESDRNTGDTCDRGCDP